jgi:phosphate transport system substrate-binding protein
VPQAQEEEEERKALKPNTNTHNRSRRLGLLAGVAALAFAGVPAGESAAKSTITLSGSTSIAPLAAKLARRYVKETHGRVAFRLNQGGSDIGVADVSRGRVTLGMSSRDPKPGDPGGIFFNRIARDAICLATNKKNTVPDLSQGQVQQIFGGGVRNWSQIPGSTVGGTINLFVRTAASGTQDAFQKIFMGTTKVSSTAAQRGSNGLVQQSVRSSTGGIGYLSLAFTKGLHDIRYKGVACTLRNAKAGTYGGIRSFWMISRGHIHGAAKKWVRWIRRDKDARRITASEWVPLR